MNENFSNVSGTVSSGWLKASECKVVDLDRLAQTETRAQDCPQATTILKGVPIYDGRALRAAQAASADPQSWRRQLMVELANVWRSGPGVLVVQGLLQMLQWWTLHRWNFAR